jgi:hypothetical protein
MKLKFYLAFLVFLCVGILFLPGCKTAEDTTEFTLSVSVGAGVAGTPASGTYSHTEGATVTYNYSLESGYSNLVVTLDGTPVAASGTLTVSGNHSLSATAEPEAAGFDIRGKWSGFWYWNTGTIIYDVFFTVTFEGEAESGITIANMDRVWGCVNGTYTVDGNQVKFNIEIYGGLVIVIFGGTVENDNLMRGWYDSSNNSDARLDGWKLERQ